MDEYINPKNDKDMVNNIELFINTSEENNLTKSVKRLLKRFNEVKISRDNQLKDNARWENEIKRKEEAFIEKEVARKTELERENYISRIHLIKNETDRNIEQWKREELEQELAKMQDKRFDRILNNLKSDIGYLEEKVSDWSFKLEQRELLELAILKKVVKTLERERG